MTHHDHDHTHDHHDHHHDHHHHDASHDHHHSHDHTHDHDPHDHHASESPMRFEEKIQTLLSHWVNHNNDHAKNYLEWSRKTQEAGRADIGNLLKEASEMTGKITAVFEKALTLSKQ